MKQIVNTAVPRPQLLCVDHGAPAIRDRRARLHEPHVAALTDWVDSVRRRLDPCHAETVCDFDPDGGGVEAQVMYLAQDPSSTASGTGFISPDNNDSTAKATTEACIEADLRARERIHWNVFPWWLDAPCSSRIPNSRLLAGEMLAELFRLLPEVRSVVLIGNKAEESWEHLASQGEIRTDIRVWTGPHPSYGWWAKPYRPSSDGRLGREVVVDALRRARSHALG